jgi:hypothetical protein
MPNPWMSLWLSAANAWAGAVRGFWTAERRRQQTAMINEMTRQMARFWTAAWAQPTLNARNGTRRRYGGTLRIPDTTWLRRSPSP